MVLFQQFPSGHSGHVSPTELRTSRTSATVRHEGQPVDVTCQIESVLQRVRIGMLLVERWRGGPESEARQAPLSGFSLSAFRSPGGAGSIVLEARGTFQIVLGFVQGQPLRGLYRRERHDHVLFACPQEAADADDEAVILPDLSTRTSSMSPILLSFGS